MTLLESYACVKESSDLFDTRMAKVKAFTNAAFNEHAINLEECELKVMKESGTIDDLAYLVEEANEGLVGRVKDAIAAIIKAFKEFFQSIKSKVLAAISGIGDTVGAIEKKIKMNPILARKKVQYEDAEKEISVCDKYLDKIKRLLAKSKHKDIDPKEVSDLEDEYDKARKVAIAGAATILTVAAVMVLVKKHRDKTGSEVAAAEKEGNDILNQASSGFGEDVNESKARVLESISRFTSKVSKDKANAILDKFGKAWTGLKNAVGSSAPVKATAKAATKAARKVNSKIPAKVKPVKPLSPEWQEAMDFTGESAQDEEDAAYLESLHNELFSDDDEYTREYMESLENDIFGDLDGDYTPDYIQESVEDDETDNFDMSGALDSYFDDNF